MFIIFSALLLTGFVRYIIFVSLKFNIMVCSIAIILTVVGSPFNLIHFLYPVLSPKDLNFYIVYVDSSLSLNAVILVISQSCSY